MLDLNTLPPNAGVLLCGHGSRATAAQQEFALLVDGLRARVAGLRIEYGFLEYASPNIHMALDALLAQGVDTIYALPGMLFRATHARNDIPAVLTTYRQKHPGLKINYGQELGLHEDMLRAFEQRILQALGLTRAPAAGALYDTLLVVVGRGTSVATANAEAAKLTRIVAENLGFGWSETVYSGVTFPSVGAGLEMALKLGFKKIVVAPYFLFSGHLIGRIYAYVDRVAAAHPQLQFFKADYLRAQEHVVSAFIARLSETIQAAPDQGGLMQDFARRLAKGEVHIHHHHAEFQPPEPNAAAPGHNHHDHHHDHAHDHAHAPHSHAPYRHIAHPLGPRSMIDQQVCCCFMSQIPTEIVQDERARRGHSSPDAAAQPIPQCQQTAD